MKTITAVELRNNMKEIFRRVQNGEEINVSYRNSEPVRLSTNKTHSKKKAKSGLDALLEALDDAKIQTKAPSKYKTGNLKELYYEDMAKKYGLS